MRSWSNKLRKAPEKEGPIESIFKTLFFLFVLIGGLISAIYLVANALYLLFLAVVFGQYSPHTTALEYLAFVAKNALPAFGFAAIGILGLRFWLSERFWTFGLFALSVEAALAIYVFVDPEGMLIFVR